MKTILKTILYFLGKTILYFLGAFVLFHVMAVGIYYPDKWVRERDLAEEVRKRDLADDAAYAFWIKNRSAEGSNPCADPRINDDSRIEFTMTCPVKNGFALFYIIKPARSKAYIPPLDRRFLFYSYPEPDAASEFIPPKKSLRNSPEN